MQTFSNMRRNSTHKESLIPIRWIIFLVIYQMITSLYMFLTPLIGFMFCYLIILYDEEKRDFEDYSLKRYLAFGYLIFAVLNKGFYLFSGVAFFYIFYNLFAGWLQVSFKCKSCILATYVAVGYVGIYLANNLLAYMFHEDFFYFGWEYGVYILSDFLLTLLFFRDRLI